MTEPRNGPPLADYIETRLNLMTVSADKTEAALRERIDAVESAGLSQAESFIAMRDAFLKAIDERFKYFEQLTSQSADNAKRAVDKSEAAQGAHNVAANEWRGTLNDFKATLVTKTEFDRFYTEFAAFKLETARTTSLVAGEKSREREGKDDSKAWIAIAISVATAVVALAALFFSKGTP